MTKIKEERASLAYDSTLQFIIEGTQQWLKELALSHRSKERIAHPGLLVAYAPASLLPFTQLRTVFMK